MKPVVVMLWVFVSGVYHWNLVCPAGYVDMVVIPEGARDIFIQERGEAGNFLAMKRPNSEDYYLNGNFIIQWNGEYKAGEAKFFYDRIGNLENLTSPGPTTEPIMIQVCVALVINPR